MDETTTLMLLGETRACRECGTDTIHLPVDDGPPATAQWCCTACDAAVVVLVAA